LKKKDELYFSYEQLANPVTIGLDSMPSSRRVGSSVDQNQEMIGSNTIDSIDFYIKS